MNHTTADLLTHQEFEQLAANAHRSVSEFLARRHKDSYLADAVTTDSITAAWERWAEDPSYFVEHDLIAWVRQRATWRALDDLRRRGRWAPLVEEHQGDEGDGAARAPDAFAVAVDDDEREERNRLVHQTIQHLDEEDRFLVEGMVYEGLTDQALGARLFGRTAGTVTALGLRAFRRRQRALARLRERLIALGLDDNDLTVGQAV